MTPVFLANRKFVFSTRRHRFMNSVLVALLLNCSVCCCVVDCSFGPGFLFSWEFTRNVMFSRHRFYTLKTDVTSIYKTTRGHIPDAPSLSCEMPCLSVCLVNESPCHEEVDGMNVWLWAVVTFTKGMVEDPLGLSGQRPSPIAWNRTAILLTPSRYAYHCPRKLSFLASYFVPTLKLTWCGNSLNSSKNEKCFRQKLQSESKHTFHIPQIPSPHRWQHDSSWIAKATNTHS